jgi:catechol 2,3-dioxygenase-like lactoylglutathione lyase family enzyme
LGGHTIDRDKEDPVQQTATHITQLGRVIIPVSDQEKALEFYTGTLGFEVRADIPFGEGDRWLEVGPAEGGAGIALMPPRPGAEPGHDQACVALTTTDIDADHRALKEKGVDVDEPMGGEDPVPRMFFFRDPDGNNLLVVQEGDA